MTSDRSNRSVIPGGHATAFFAAAALLFAGAGATWMAGTNSETALTCVALDICAAAAFAVTGALRLRHQTRERESRLRLKHHPQVVALADACPDAMIFLDPVADSVGEVQDFRISHTSARANQMLSPAAPALAPGSISSAMPFLATPSSLQQFRNVLATGTPRTFTLAVQEPNLAAEWLRVSVTRFEQGLLLTLADISAARESERQMCRQIQQDALTGLPNRTLLDDRIQQAIRRARRNKQAAAVLLLDIDDFRLINDKYGRAAGDHVLRTVAQRLTDAVRTTDSVVRLGGDEFVIVFPDVFTHGPVTDFARKIVLSLFAPVSWNGHELHITASMGVAMYPEAGTTPETLLVQADIERNRRKHSNSPAAFPSPAPSHLDSRTFSLLLN